MPPVSGEIGLGRRQAALALFASAMGLSSCGRPPEESLPYVVAPEGAGAGLARRYATTLALGGLARGVIATCHEGRPVKLEGNPSHPGSLGGSDPFLEAEVLSLYDPDRSRVVRQAGSLSTWSAFEASFAPRLERLAAEGGRGLHVLTGAMGSPTELRLLHAARERLPAMAWHVHEPMDEEQANEASQLAFDAGLRAMPRLDRAQVVLTLDADPLGPGPLQPVLARHFAAMRQARRDGTRFMRLYAAEPVMSVTGAKADRRLATSHAMVQGIARALAARLGAAVDAPALPSEVDEFCAAAAEDLSAHRGAAMVLAGPSLPASTAALVHWVNAALEAPVEYRAAPPPTTGLGALTTALREGAVDTLIVLGANPAYASAGDLGFVDALTAAKPYSVHLGAWQDETAVLCRWHLPALHALENWSDHRAWDGSAAIAQPLITPLHAGRSPAWLLAWLAGQRDAAARDLVRDTWRAVWRETDDVMFERRWRQSVRSGVIAGSATPPLSPPVARLPALSPLNIGTEMALLLRPDATLWDGRYANNPWLQECPEPLTRQVWGNAALLAPGEAAARGIVDGDQLQVRVDGRAITLPALVMPGQARGVVVVSLGHGRWHAGAIGNGVGADAYVLRRAASPWVLPGVEVTKFGQGVVLRPQEAHRIEGEAASLAPMLSLATLGEGDTDEPRTRPTFYDIPPRSETKWAMVIDTTLCIGCNACVTACQAENNVPIVGPEEIAVGRDMHWLRIDTYWRGGEEEPRPVFQPVPCMHCEEAPCEPVCPVAASVHDAEGLNVQVYNRCIGTRFCQSNCPYKVRRFNFHGYANGQEYANQGDPLLAAQRNPEVTVRGRGVMEKCTYCVQRISAARREAEKSDRPIPEGGVVTACQAACPARAIAFGDLGRPDSNVSVLRREPQHYALLAELGTRPRTTYLAAIRNEPQAAPSPPLHGSVPEKDDGGAGGKNSFFPPHDRHA